MGELQSGKLGALSQNRSKEKEESSSDLENPSVQDLKLPKRKAKISVSICEWLISICRDRRQVKALKKAEEDILKGFDIITLAKYAAQFEKFKACYMSPEQRILFESLSRPSLIIDTQQTIKSSNSIQIDDWIGVCEYDERKVREAYLALKRKHTNNPVDVKLTSLYEKKYFSE